MVHEIQGKAEALNGLHHVLEAPAAVQKIVWAAENNFDAVIQSNTFDPGVEGGRLAVRIPVIGLLRTALGVASTMCDRVGILAPLASHLPTAWRTISSYQMDRRVVSMRALGMYGSDLKLRKEELRGKALDLVRSMVERDRVECIIPLGGRLIPYIVDPADLQAETGVSVLNTKAIGIQFAEMCVRTGVTHSPLSYPPSQLRHAHFLQTAFQ